MKLVAFINTAHLLCHYCLLILPTAVLAMAARDGAFGGDYGPILELATAMFVLYGLLSLPQGWLAARFGRRAMIAAYFFGTGAALIAASLTRTPLGLEVALAAAGAFAAIYHPVGTAMLVEAAGERPGRALGINGVCGNAGVALAPVDDGGAGEPVWLAGGVCGAGSGVCGAGCGLAAPARQPSHSHAVQPDRSRRFRVPWFDER